MSTEHKELIEYLDEKFTRIEDRFGRIEDHFGGIEDRFGRIEITLEQKADKADVNNLVNAIDRLIKSVEDLKLN